MIKTIPLLGIILCYNYTVAQRSSHTVSDSLSSKSFEYFNEIMPTLKNDSVKKLVYAKSWLRKAKAMQDMEEAVEAYKALAYNGHEKDRLSYADSMIMSAKQTTDKELIGYAYMTKGILYYSRKELMQALDIYITADEYIAKTEDYDTAYKIKYGIANIKYYLGYYKEAIVLFKQCLVYFEKANKQAYMNTLHSLSASYNKIGMSRACSQINNFGLQKGKELVITAMEPYFIHVEGLNQYSLRNYNLARAKLHQVLPILHKRGDFANETVAYFYIGKSYWTQGKNVKAVYYFNKVDNAFKKYNYISPDLREAYELLIKYYVQQKDINAQLYYINQLLRVDKNLHTNFKYLSGKIHKEYDTKKLLEAKKEIETTMYYNKVISASVILLMTLVIVLLIRRHFRNKKLFEELMKRQPASFSVMETVATKENDLEINPALVKEILKKLEKFEKKRKYLGKDMTLIRVAALLNTNTKYISKIIYRHRGKKFIEYINDLKIDYIVQILKEENKYRNYTNKALGEEAGFGSTQNFTRAFNSRTGISPTYFIQQLKKTQSVTLVNQDL